MKPITTKRLVIRNWENRDRDLFFRINSDDQVMEFFPFRRTKAESDALFEVMKEEIARNGFGFTALELRETGECIGFAGLHETNGIPLLGPGAIEIGWRLASEHWGKGYVTEAALALLDFGFDKLDLAEIVSFAVWNNERSIAVMKRLGMRRDRGNDFDHPRVPDTHPHLMRHFLYRLDQNAWTRQRKTGATAAPPRGVVSHRS